MIKKLFNKIKKLFEKRRSFKSIHKICEHPIYLFKVGKYIPCGKCTSCKYIYDLAKTQEYIDKYKRCSLWVTKY